jgi:repressor LexA
MKILTKKQSKILAYVQKKIEEAGYAPAYQEIAEHFGLRSKATVAQHLATLETKGYLKLPGGRAGPLVASPPSHLSLSYIQIYQRMLD